MIPATERTQLLLGQIARRLDAEPAAVVEVALESLNAKLAPDLHTVPAELARIRRRTKETRSENRADEAVARLRRDREAQLNATPEEAVEDLKRQREEQLSEGARGT